MFKEICRELNQFFKLNLIGDIFTGDFFRNYPSPDSEEDDEAACFFQATEKKA